MEELRLLARAVFVLDADNKVVYKKSLVKVLISQILMLLCIQKYLIIKEINLKMYTSCPSLSTALK